MLFLSCFNIFVTFQVVPLILWFDSTVTRQRPSCPTRCPTVGLAVGRRCRSRRSATSLLCTGGSRPWRLPSTKVKCGMLCRLPGGGGRSVVRAPRGIALPIGTIGGISLHPPILQDGQGLTVGDQLLLATPRARGRPSQVSALWWRDLIHVSVPTS